MAKQAASVSLTAGEGFNYEDHVAARFLVDMLGGIAPFGPEFGHVVRVDWQARDTGRLLDDLRITLDAPDGRHVAELSIKSHRQVTTAGFPPNFVEAAWEQWRHAGTTAFERDRDLLVLVTAEIANDVIESWHTLLRESLITTPDRMLSRLGETTTRDAGSQSSQTERSVFSSFRCHDALTASGPSDEAATVEVIRRVRLLHFDFKHDPSQDEARAIADCQRLLRSSDHAEAGRLWRALLGLAAEHRTGGSLDLERLLSKLRSSFDFADHPDFRADWEALERASQDILADIRTQIGGEATLNRQREIQRLSRSLATAGICLAAGESGCGKSALAKTLGTSNYASTVALSPELFEGGSQRALEQQLRLSHSLLGVLSAGRDSCLLFFDSMERFSEPGLRLAARIINELLASEHSQHVHILLVTQFDAANRVVAQLAEAGVERAKLGVTQIDFPREAEMRDVLREVPGIPWATLHRDIRPLVRNLKIVDWMVHAARTGAHLDASQVTGLVSLIDYLWDRWVEAGGQGPARGGLLKRLAVIEASTLASGVPLTQLEHPELQSLSDLMLADLLKRRNERVMFSHDLLGDWARLRVLIGEDPTRSGEALRRVAAARWHRAVRLLGRWLLAQADGLHRWSQALARADNGTTNGTLVRDLLLEAVVLSENSRQLLDLAWPVLIANEARLLKRLLDRFLFVATVPDLRVCGTVADRSLAPQVEAAFRVPFWPYWEAVLQALDEHVGDVCLLAASEAAQICRIWLEKMPKEIVAGTRFPWRDEAGRVALRIAREMQAQRAEGRFIRDREDRVAYEGTLLAAHEL
ncbi:MAG TPA: hypothetical protein PK867_18505, partial [Pirellulales bacterium]|nr:hypothetical protein [Pirellulales bacterium]